MITSSQAQQIICENWISPREKTLKLSDSLGMVVSRPVFAANYAPTFNRVAMDGFSFSYSTMNYGERLSFTEVSTGEVLPSHHDTVIPYEQVDCRGEGITIRQPSVVKSGQNVHWRGDDYELGQLLVEEGTKINSTHIGLLASNGNAVVDVYDSYRIAVISSGSELVDLDDELQVGQVYKSNVYSIISELRGIGQGDVDLFHLRDCKDEIKRELAQIVGQYDLVFISGGVSKGKDDFIARALTDVGIKTLFHYVRHRPGKPFLFGKGNRCLVFGLPGNPVASIVCLKRYVSHLFKSANKPVSAKLSTDISFGKALTCYKLVSCELRGGELFVAPVDSTGSADQLALSRSDGFVELDLNKKKFSKDELLPFYSWDR